MKKEAIKELPFFYDRYINLVEDDVLLMDLLERTKTIFSSLKKELNAQADYSYQEGKWTPKDILQHCIDTERIMCYRALAIARGESQGLIGYDENVYANHTNATYRTIDDLIDEFELVRQATLLQFKNFGTEMLLREGKCSGIAVTPLVLGFVCVGHPLHHINTLRERYLN